jgi:hypothetical protein
MPFEIGNFINGGADRVSGSPFFSGILRNPVFTSLMITVLAMVIIYALFKRELRGTGAPKAVKAGFWLLLGVSAVVFLHYYVVDHSLKKSNRAQLAQDTVSTIYSAEGGFGGTHYPILEPRHGGSSGDPEKRSRSPEKQGAPPESTDGEDDDVLKLVEMRLPDSEL